MTDSDSSVVEEKSRHRHKKSKKAIVEKFVEENPSNKSKHSEKKKSKDALVKYSSDNESSDEKIKAKKRKMKEDETILKFKNKKKQKVASKHSVGPESENDDHVQKTNERRKESKRKDDILDEESKTDKDEKRKDNKANKSNRRHFNNSSEESDGHDKQSRNKTISEKGKRREEKCPDTKKQTNITESKRREMRDQRNNLQSKSSAHKELQDDSKYEDDYRDGRNRTRGHNYGDINYDDTSSHDNHTMDNYSANEEGGKPVRYWSSSRGPIRKNSDSYWNKYSDRLKESFDHLEVGPRYYASGDDKKKEKSSSNRRNDKKIEDLDNDKKEAPSKEAEPPKPKKTVDILLSRTGGAYIPPARLRMMQESITDKSSAAYQRLAWEALKKSIQGHVNKVNISNINVIWKQVLKENIVRGKGLLCRALIQAQAASPSFTNVYAAFASILNAKFPKVGELLLKRLVVQFRRGFKRNDKSICITAVTFIAHLVNQEVAHEIIALEILTLLIESPTDDSIEVAIAFLKESGMKLNEVSRKGLTAIFDMLRNILHEGKLEKRVQYMIEVVFQIRKEEFKAHPSVIPELSLVDEDDRIQHMITLEENHDPEDILNVFRLDPDYEANEAKYKSLVEDDLDSENDEGEGSDGSGDSDSGSDNDDEAQEEGEKKDVIVDKTETNLVALRKTIYLTIQSSLDFEECAHKLLRMELKPGQEIEMAHMFLDCCAEQRTYEKFFGLLAQRFCQINRVYIAPFEQTFRDSYETIHRMSNDKLRNVGKLFAHLLFTDAISWDVLSIIRLNEDETTSSSRIFIKILFLELSEYMGLAKLNQRVKDPALQTALEGLFPRDNPKHTRFAINFFTSIGLGGLTDELREHLKSQPKPAAVPQLVEDLSSTSSSSDSSSESSDSSDSSSSSSSSDSSSDSEDHSKKRKNRGKPKKVESKKKPAMTKDKSKSSSRSSSSKKNSKDNSSSRRNREK